MASSMVDKLRTVIRAFYHVPWCMPAWGWAEFAVTARAVAMARVSKGPHTAALIREARQRLGVDYVLPFNRGRTAITIALKALDLASQSEVLIPSYVCHTVAEAVVNAGMNPRFADIEPDGHLSVASVKSALTPCTRCVIVPHLYGNVAPVAEIEAFLNARDIPMIDDAAQSFGAYVGGKPVGTFGRCGIVACGPGKNLAGAAGGLLVTNDRLLYEAARDITIDCEPARLVLGRVLDFWVWRRLRRYTLPLSIIIDRLFRSTPRVAPHVIACLSDLDAGIMREQLNRLDENISIRRANARMLAPLLQPLVECNLSDLSDGGTVTKLVVVLPDRGILLSEAIELMSRAGIECQEGYAGCHADYGETGYLPNTATLAERVLCIPVESAYRRPDRLAGLVRDYTGRQPQVPVARSDQGKVTTR